MKKPLLLCASILTLLGVAFSGNVALAQPAGIITLVLSPNTVREDADGAQTITVTAQVQGSSTFDEPRTVTVTVGGSADSARPDVNYTAAVPEPFLITIAQAMPSGSGTFTLTPIDDDGYDYDGDKTITVSGAVSGATGIVVNSAPLGLIEDERALPRANAGSSITVAEGATVMLDGSGSTDPESEALTYAWRQDGGLAVSLSSASAQMPTFTAPINLVADAVLQFSLTVTNARSEPSTNTAQVTVTVTAGPATLPPVGVGQIAALFTGVSYAVTPTMDEYISCFNPAWATDQWVQVPRNFAANASFLTLCTNRANAGFRGAGRSDHTIFGGTGILPNLTVFHHCAPLSGGMLVVMKSGCTLRGTVDRRGVMFSSTEVTATEGGAATYTVKLSSAATGLVMVTPFSRQAAVASVLPPVLSFNAGNWSNPQTVTVTGVNDDVDISPQASRTADITHTVMGANYNGVAVATVRAVIADDDTATVTLATTPDSVLENDSATVITVTATVDDGITFGAVQTVVITVAGATANAPADFTAMPAMFNIEIAAQTATGSGTFTLTPVPDAVAGEGDETITVRGTVLPGQSAANEAQIVLFNSNRPTFTNAAAFATPIPVVENQTAVRGADYFAATDTPTGNLTLGGADAGLFTLSGTGTLIFNDPPNFEMPRGMAFDASTNTNDYALTVTAVNGTGPTMSGPITVRVTDVIEPPSAPTGLAVVSRTANSITLEWDAAANTGPPITAYQLRHFPAGGSVDATFVEAGVATTVTATGLTPGDTYDFQISATNDEGTSSFSPVQPVQGQTLTPLPTGFTLTVDPTVVTESSTPTDVTFTITLLNGTFPVARSFFVASVGGAPAAGTDYTAVSNVNFTIPARMTTDSVTIPFTAHVDMEIETGGETVLFRAGLFTVRQDGTDSTFGAGPTATITINDAPPAFADDASIADQIYTMGTAITPLTLPQITPGDSATTYTLTPAIAGLTLDPASRVLTGAPTTIAAVTQYTYTASDADDDIDTLTFNITVEANTAPAIAGGGTIPEQNFIANVAIEPVTLPDATGGNGATIYALTPAIAGLTLDPSTRVLSGTPTTVGTTNHDYTARDSDADTSQNDLDVASVRITVRAQATGFTVVVRPDLGGSAVTEVLEGADPRLLRVTATPTPSGSAFAVDQTVTFSATPPILRPANAADPFVSYTPIGSGTVTLVKNRAGSVATSITLSPVADLFDHADFPVTITATAAPSSASGTATITLLDDDIGIRTSVAAVSVTQSETATYNVQLGEQPPAAATVSVVSQTPANATVTPATLTFSTTNWNMAQTVTVTGVLAGTADIRHTAPPSGDFTYVTNDVAVTVIALVPTTPVFTNPDISTLLVAEGNAIVVAANLFAATGTGAVALTLGGADAGLFTLTDGGTLTFNTAPDFEMPRGMALSGSNINNYPLTVTATASGLTSDLSFLVRVTNVNEPPVLAAITPSAFTEYSEGAFDIDASDVDTGDTLAFTLNGETYGATITAGGTFTWTPGEDDGAMARTFSVTITDDGSPPMSATRSFDITATELRNRAPTSATITVAAAVTISNTLVLEAAGVDPDTGDTLTYTWRITDSDSGSIAPIMGPRVIYTPPDTGAVPMITIRLTVSDGSLSLTGEHVVTVNPLPAAGHRPGLHQPGHVLNGH